VSATHLSTIFHGASPLVSNHLTTPQLRFSMSTIAFQAIGFFMLPFNTQNLFTAKSEQTIRRTQMFMPLYMMMFPFLVIVAYYQLGLHTHLNAPSGAFMAVAVQLLPHWVIGIVAAGASLSGLLVLAGISLAIGPLLDQPRHHCETVRANAASIAQQTAPGSRLHRRWRQCRSVTQRLGVERVAQADW
jgi:SSS family solute:Na+ symporter